MDGIFGIGPLELFFIAIIALIVLGPERLPSALREIAKTIRRMRELTSEFTSQFDEELKALDELNPRKILNDMTNPNKPMPGEKPKKPADPAASPTGENKALTPPKTPENTKAKATANAILASQKATEAARATKAAKEAEAKAARAASENSILPPNGAETSQPETSHLETSETVTSPPETANLSAEVETPLPALDNNDQATPNQNYIPDATLEDAPQSTPENTFENTPENAPEITTVDERA